MMEHLCTFSVLSLGVWQKDYLLQPIGYNLPHWGVLSCFTCLFLLDFMWFLFKQMQGQNKNTARSNGLKDTATPKISLPEVFLDNTTSFYVRLYFLLFYFWLKFSKVESLSLYISLFVFWNSFASSLHLLVYMITH